MNTPGDPRPPKRNTDANALRRGRVSIAHADYFVTVCLDPRLPILTPDVAPAVFAELHAMTSDATWTLRCATVMPDHLHLLITLGERLTLSQSLSRLKTKLLPPLLARRTNWQSNFYDRHLRPGDSVEATIRYIWMNPYQAGLIPASATWPWFYCRVEEWTWFQGLTDTGRPIPEWLV